MSYGMTVARKPAEDVSWFDRAECAGFDTNMFYCDIKDDDEPRSKKELGQITNDAKEYCAVCPVARECLNYALKTGQEFGVWGGMTARERTVFRNQLRGNVSQMDSHGSEAAYRKHLKLGTVPCAECRRAHARYVADCRKQRRIREVVESFG